MTIRVFLSSIDPISIDEVEPWTEIVKFKTGPCLMDQSAKNSRKSCYCMNRIGGKSNSGEGGEIQNVFKRSKWRF
jgi:glutamate synthase (ferredoxin)